METQIEIRPAPTHRFARYDYRCRVCGAYLMRAYLAPGSHLEIKCWRSKCKTTTVIDVPMLEEVAAVVKDDTGNGHSSLDNNSTSVL